MPDLDFFATREDFVEIFDNLFSQTDVQVFETYSEADQELRRFRSTEEILSALPIGIDKYGNSSANLLSLWSPSVIPEPEIRRINLSKSTGHTFRYRVHDVALMHLHLGGLFEKTITKSEFSHFSEKEASRWEDTSHADWLAHRKLSNKIIYLIGRKLRVARVPFAAVLKGAMKMKEQGYMLMHGGHLCEIIQGDERVTRDNQ